MFKDEEEDKEVILGSRLWKMGSGGAGDEPCNVPTI